jgi:predicted acyl esterase
MGHVFAAGSRIRLQVAGGSDPRLTRNLGVPDPVGEATEMRGSTHVIDLAASFVEMPVVAT